MPPHVFIATPCYGGLVTQGYMQSVCALMAAAPALGIELTLALLGQDALITRSRNSLLSAFRTHPTATHILFIDADISFEPRHLFRMLDFAKPVIAGIYPLKASYWDATAHARLAAGEDPKTACLHYVGSVLPERDVEREDGFATAEYAGTGFMLIERRTVEEMAAAYPDTRYVGTHAFSVHTAPQEHFALFDCVIDPETGIYLSEDFTFCKRWRSLGGRIWLDTTARLTHTGASDFRGDPACRQTSV